MTYLLPQRKDYVTARCALESSQFNLQSAVDVSPQVAAVKIIRLPIDMNTHIHRVKNQASLQNAINMILPSNGSVKIVGMDCEETLRGTLSLVQVSRIKTMYDMIA